SSTVAALLQSTLLYTEPPSTSEAKTLSLHDALPISFRQKVNRPIDEHEPCQAREGIPNGLRAILTEPRERCHGVGKYRQVFELRLEEHTSELQSRVDLVCRLVLEKKH